MSLNDPARYANRGDVRRNILRHDRSRANNGPVAYSFSVNNDRAGAEVNAVAESYATRNMATGIDVAIGADDCIVADCRVQVHDGVRPDFNLGGQDAARGDACACSKLDPSRHPGVRVNHGAEIEAEGRSASGDCSARTRVSHTADDS